MLAVLGDHGLIFEKLFLEWLPEDIRIQVVDMKIKDHRQLVKQADALWTGHGI